MLSSSRLGAWPCPRLTPRGTPNEMRLFDRADIEWVRGPAIATAPDCAKRISQGTVSFSKTCAGVTSSVPDSIASTGPGIWVARCLRNYATMGNRSGNRSNNLHSTGLGPRTMIQVAELKDKNGKLTVWCDPGLSLRQEPPVEGNADV